MDIALDILAPIPRGLIYLVLGLLVLIAAKMVRDVVTRYSIEQEIASQANGAVAIRLCGYLAGVIFIFAGSVYQPWSGGGNGAVSYSALPLEIMWVAAYAAIGIAILNLVRPLCNHLVLHQFNVDEQVVQKRNVGVAAAECGMTMAVGLIVAGSIAGQGGHLVALAFLGLGLGVLLLFAVFYEWTTPFSVHDQLEKANTAVGVTLGANFVAIGLVIFKATFGDFAGWGHSMMAFGFYAVLGFVLLYALRLAADVAMMPSTRISRQVGLGNLGIAYVESAVVVSEHEKARA